MSYDFSDDSGDGESFLNDSGDNGDTGSSLDSYDATNTSGAVPYNPDTNTGATTGGVINTAQNPLPAPDASGGSGSFLSQLQNTMTQGLNDSIISATEFGLGSLSDRLSVNANAAVQYASAQGVPARAAAKGPSPLFLIGAAVAVYFIFFHKA
jgi:hypothetical protein